MDPISEQDMRDMIILSIFSGLLLMIAWQYLHVTPVSIALQVWSIGTTATHTMAAWVDTAVHTVL
jgi:hypothetical protein